MYELKRNIDPIKCHAPITNHPLKEQRSGGCRSRVKTPDRLIAFELQQATATEQLMLTKSKER
jgi:hypothetical protein